jgi:hypothetical protein
MGSLQFDAECIAVWDLEDIVQSLVITASHNDATTLTDEVNAKIR